MSQVTEHKKLNENKVTTCDMDSDGEDKKCIQKFCGETS
jgi:hypothetical protein